MLKSLSDNVWRIGHILKSTSKLMLSYELLLQCIHYCPSEEKKLEEELKRKLEELEQRNAEALRDYRHYSLTSNEATKYPPLTVIQFQTILTNFTDELGSYIPSDDLGNLITILLKDWMSGLCTEISLFLIN